MRWRKKSTGWLLFAFCLWFWASDLFFFSIFIIGLRLIYTHTFAFIKNLKSFVIETVVLIELAIINQFYDIFFRFFRFYIEIANGKKENVLNDFRLSDIIIFDRLMQLFVSIYHHQLLMGVKMQRWQHRSIRPICAPMCVRRVYNAIY